MFPVVARNPGRCDGFDQYAGQRWIYPNNMTIRGYQKAAVELALFNNAMIVLPTGFGKTFIAAVVMYNFYRWYPDGRIIFVAPTKPLVAQQIHECRKITGIPKADCAELTGHTGVEKRREVWQEKRVFFATPQVIENDLANGLLPAKFVRCIVFDEAHRAQGGFSYVNIARHLQDHNRDGFRVLALSATPGSDIARVRQVMLNLYISEVMFRSETSIDLMQYRNEKCSKAWTVELVGKHREFVDKFIEMTNPIFKELHRAGLTYNGDSIERVAKYTLIKAMTAADNNESRQGGSTRGRLKFLCGAGMTLKHNFDLLTLYGIRVFYSSVKRNMEEPRSAVRHLMATKPEFITMNCEIENIFGEDLELNPYKKPTVNLLQGHPKLSVVKDLLLKHFEANIDKKETRAIVFTKYRESVYDIVQTMTSYEPLIKPTPFVGQGHGSGKKAGQGGVGGMSQKEQIELIKKFRDGQFNVMVATCVAEEGLDIGEVDLIICYDTSSSPISTTQRRGRTGRKRSGNVQTILTKGYEEKRLQQAGASRRQVEDQLFKKENYTPFKYRDAPRMVPASIIPVCLEHKVFAPPDEPEEVVTPKSKRKKREKKSPGSTGGKRKGGKLGEKKKKLDDEDNDNSDDDDLVLDSAEKIKKRLKKEKRLVSDDELEWGTDEVDGVSGGPIQIIDQTTTTTTTIANGNGHANGNGNGHGYANVKCEPAPGTSSLAPAAAVGSLQPAQAPVVINLDDLSDFSESCEYD